MNIKTICVCGAGAMGSGIAQAAAQAGIPAMLYEINTDVLSRAKTNIEKSLQSLVEKGKLTAEEKEATSQRLQFTNDSNDCVADLIIEAIIEKTEAKVALFNQLSAINTADTIFASNTSSLSISKIAEQVKGPERFIGIHFFNPATIMKLVEVITTASTPSYMVTAVTTLIQKMKKVPVVCKDSPGFIVNRVARPFYIESLRIAEEGQVGFETIDSLLENAGFRMGPFKLMDLIGNDVNYAVSCSVYEQLNKPERLKPSYIQKEKVEKGELGKKTGKGYYPLSP